MSRQISGTELTKKTLLKVIEEFLSANEPAHYPSQFELDLRYLVDAHNDQAQHPGQAVLQFNGEG